MLSPPTSKMFADRQAMQLQHAVLLGRADQRQIGRAAADVADQQPITDGQLLAPGIALVIQPRVDSRLRFFQQDEIRRNPSRDRRLARQLASTRVKRRRYRQHDLLLGQRCVGMGIVPGGNQMFQSSGASP